MSKNKAKAITALCQATLVVATKKQWDTVTLAAIAKQARIPLAEATTLVEDRDALLPWLVLTMNERVANSCSQPESAASLKEKLFDILMTRFEFLQEHRTAMVNINRALRNNPRLLLTLTKPLYAAMQESFALAGKPSPSRLEIMALLGLYSATSLTWERDSSHDLAKTMAALDRNLTRAESILSRGQQLCRKLRERSAR